MARKGWSGKMSKTNIKVALIGADGNVFNLMGICRRALQKAGRMDLWDEFYREVTSGDYNHALAVMTDYFVVCGTEDKD